MPDRRASAAAAAGAAAGGGGAKDPAADGPPSPPPPPPPLSRRVLSTDAPVVAKTKAIIASAADPSAVASLAQGVVHWPPPPAALRAAARLAADAARGDPAASALLHSYGPTPGYPPLRRALRRKMERWGLRGYAPVVTPGANCAFTVALLALCDEGDSVVLFPPYYFNHKMSVQMTGGGRALRVAPMREDDLRPDLDWLEREMASSQAQGGGDGGEDGEPAARPPRIRVVVLVNPANPTGVQLSREELDRASSVAARHGAWLVVDATYADFNYGRITAPYFPPGPNVVLCFSMSKAYGMMGWRVGWLGLPPAAAAAAAAPASAGAAVSSSAGAASSAYGAAAAEDLGDGGALMDEILKVQDSIPICATMLSQAVALAALEGDEGGGEDFGDVYVSAQVAGLAQRNRPVVRAALVAALGEANVLGGEGGIYFFARLPSAFAERARARSAAEGGSSSCGGDDDVVAWLVRRAGVCVLPGSACAAPGWLRVSFANLPAGGPCEEAAARLQKGLEELVRLGVAALDGDGDGDGA